MDEGGLETCLIGRFDFCSQLVMCKRKLFWRIKRRQGELNMKMHVHMETARDWYFGIEID